jgi:cation diffusion facilitator family transporter
MTSSPPPAAPSGGLLGRLDAMSPRTLLWLSIWTAVATIAFKMAAWWVSGSVSLLSDAMESFVNLASAVFALRMVIVAHWPADAEHPYGHHKAEYFSSGFEGMLILVAAAAIGWASVHRLMDPQPLERVGLGALLSVISSVLNGLLAWRLMRGARVHRSIALEADARHLMTDVWTTAGVLVGIAAVLATGWLWLDPAVALLVALNILHEGGKLVWRSAQGLMDEAVEPEVQALIHEALHGTLRRQPETVQDDVLIDHLTTRRAAQRRFADLHLHLPTDWTLGTAARLRGEIEYALMRAVPGLRVTIQLLPHDMEALFDDPPPPSAGAVASGPPASSAPRAPSGGPAAGTAR